MSKVSVFDHGWIDLVFEGRNKQYGAYQLRRDDQKTTVIALFTGIALIAVLVGIPAVINRLSHNTHAIVDSNQILDEEMVVVDMTPPATVEPPKPEPIQPEAAAPASSTPQVRFTTPVVASTVTAVDLPTMDDFANANPSDRNDAGNGGNDFAIGANGSPTGTATNGTGTATTGDEGIEVLGSLDEAPAFPGGLDSFYKKVGNAFNAPDIDESKTLKVFVSFVVEKDGTMSNIKVLKDPGFGMGAEAIRVLKSINTKWKPGKKGGKAVRTAYNLPITINVK